MCTSKRHFAQQITQATHTRARTHTHTQHKGSSKSDNFKALTYPFPNHLSQFMSCPNLAKPRTRDAPPKPCPTPASTATTTTAATTRVEWQRRSRRASVRARESERESHKCVRGSKRWLLPSLLVFVTSFTRSRNAEKGRTHSLTHTHSLAQRRVRSSSSHSLPTLTCLLACFVIRISTPPNNPPHREGHRVVVGWVCGCDLFVIVGPTAMVFLWSCMCG